MRKLLNTDPRKRLSDMLNKIDNTHSLQVWVPIFFAFILLTASVTLTVYVIQRLNIYLPASNNLHTVFHLGDFALGTTIYLKTAIDFAILMTLYMKSYPGWKNRIAIESGTTLGNTIGTILVIVIWGLLQQFSIVLNIMVFYSAIILIKLASETLAHVGDYSVNPSSKYPLLDFIYDIIFWPLDAFIKLTMLIIDWTWRLIESTPLKKIIPDLSISTDARSAKKNVGFWAIFAMTLGVPFALGLDDFAGYIGLLTVVNVLSFSIGVYFGHFVLNTFLFLNPKKTMKVIGHPLVSWIGSLALMFIAFLGLMEVWETLLELVHEHDLVELLFKPAIHYLSVMPQSLAILLGSILISISITIGLKRKE
jgi:hypothetical protein